VLLDLVLPDGSGRDLCRTLRRNSDVPIIMITARGQVHERIVGLEIGADDYLVKPIESAEVIARIGALLRRSRRVATESDALSQLTIADLKVDLDARQVYVGGEPARLSRKEFDLLAVLLRNRGRVVRREDLMAEVWDENWWGSTRTLDVHVGSLRRKLGDSGEAPRLIHTVRGVGFRLAVAEDRPSG
jgi:DNA-binding response OmpR family regulator